MYFDTLFIFTRSKIEFANAAVPGNVDMWYLYVVVYKIWNS